MCVYILYRTVMYFYLFGIGIGDLWGGIGGGLIYIDRYLVGWMDNECILFGWAQYSLTLGSFPGCGA